MPANPEFVPSRGKKNTMYFYDLTKNFQDKHIFILNLEYKTNMSDQEQFVYS